MESTHRLLVSLCGHMLKLTWKRGSDETRLAIPESFAPEIGFRMLERVMAAVCSSEKRKSICSQGTSARDKNSLSPYRKILLDLSRDLPKDNLEAFKFACLDRVPSAKLEEVTAGFQLFHLLQQKGAITPQNLTFLEDTMQAIGRDDLASKVNQFMKGKRNENEI